jgi:hydrophobe/amphiphile efflux-3 (HAE3) family protein
MAAPRSLTRRHPRAVLGALVALSLALAAAAPFTRWDPSPDALTIEGSSELAAYRDYLAAFGSDELLVIAFEHPDLLGHDGLATLRALTEQLLDGPGVEDVMSLDTAYDVEFGPFGPFAAPLVPDALEAAPPAGELLARVRALPLARDGLVDETGHSAAIVVKPRAAELGADARRQQRAMLDGVDAVLARPEFAGLRFHLAGSPVFNRELERLNTRDNALFTPVAAGLVAVLLALALRGAVVVALAMGCVGGTVAWVRGAMTLLGVPLDTTTSLLAPLLMVLAVCVVVHVLVRYQRERAAGRSAAEAVDEIEAHVLLPALLTAVTTAIGFVSLLVSPIASVRSFGVFSALGTLVSFLLGAVAVPAALRLLEPAGRAAGRDRVGAWLRAIARFSEQHAGKILVATAALVVLGLASLPRLRVSTHDGEFFPPDHPINLAYDFIEARFGGITPLELVFESDRPEGLRDPAALAAIARVQDFLAATPETLRGVSLADWVGQARQALEGPEAQTRPLDAASVDRAAFVLEAVAQDDLPYWVRDDWTRARLSSRTIGLDSEQNTALLARVEAAAHAAVAGVPGLSVHVTGLVPVFARMEEYLLSSQIRSFATATLSILVVFAVLLRSVGWALVAMVPNLVPVVLTLAWMALAGIPLDVVTVMIASITLGIVVDDTVHLLHGFQRARAEGLAPGAAMADALARSGHALVFTALVLSLGFATLALSEFRPTARFGELTAVTIAVALAAELLLLPALVHVTARLLEGEALAQEEAR